MIRCAGAAACESLRFGLVDLGHHDLADAATGREGLRAAQLDAPDDFDVLLLAEVLDDLVHRKVRMREGLATGSRTAADDVTLTPRAGR